MTMTKGEIRSVRKAARETGGIALLKGLLAIPKAPAGQGSRKTKRRAEGRKRANARKESENK